MLTPQHLVGVDDMIDAYTINAARAGFREADTGTLEVGKLADIVVLGRDITAIPLTDIADDPGADDAAGRETCLYLGRSARDPVQR